MRINKYISETGFCSRRETDRLIRAGRITVNGVVCEEGAEVSEGDEVWIDGRAIPPKSGRVYLLLNKPVGITCTAAPQVAGNIISYIQYPTRIFAVGRLDKASEGLILLTNDGDIVNKMMHPGRHQEKEYEVTVDKPLTAAFLRDMAGGVEIMDVMTEPCEVTAIDENKFRIILTQGLNLQIRRMCKALGYRVLKLERVRIMHLTIGSLERGAWRELTPEELSVMLVRLG